MPEHHYRPVHSGEGQTLEAELFHDDDHAVVRTLELGVITPTEYITAHMRQDDTSTLQSMAVGLERRIVKMVADLLIEEVRLAHEQIGTLYRFHQSVRPRGIAGVNDRPCSISDPKRERWSAARVIDGEGRHRGRSYRDRHAICEFYELDGEPAINARGTWKENTYYPNIRSHRRAGTFSS